MFKQKCHFGHDLAKLSNRKENNSFQNAYLKQNIILRIFLRLKETIIFSKIKSSLEGFVRNLLIISFSLQKVTAVTDRKGPKNIVDFTF